ncbi:MAG: Abi family protein [Adlercreutzia sp.]|nr:Abi family protein [Adlercreutzia sp.]
MGESFYSKKLVEKYGDPEKMLPWHFLEMASFGDTVAFYKFMFFDFAEQTVGIDIRDAADLFDAKRIKQFLFPARTLRNAAAHNDCLLHALNYRMKKPLKKIKECLLEECGLERELVENAWKINVVHDFAALLLCFDVVVPGGDTKERTARGLISLEESIGLNREFYELQNGVRDALSLMAEISLSFAEKWQSD